jgi:hypothetical protein
MCSSRLIYNKAVKIYIGGKGGPVPERLLSMIVI